MPETLWNVGIFSTVNVNHRCFRSGHLFSSICSSPNRQGPAVLPGCPVSRWTSQARLAFASEIPAAALRLVGLACCPPDIPSGGPSSSKTTDRHRRANVRANIRG
jgi:hypothetical protein